MGNRSYDEGGGIYLQSTGSQFSRLVVSNNTQTYVGGMGGGMSVFSSDDTVITYALVADNDGDFGGGLHLFQTEDFELNNVAFIGNRSRLGGGAVDTFTTGFILNNGLFTRNWSGEFGGAFAVTYGSCGALNNVTIIDNVADESSGAIYVDEACLHIKNSVVAGNQAPGTGGIYCGDWTSEVEMANTVVTNNQGSSYGGGLYGGSLGTQLFYNNNVYGNYPDNYHAPLVDPTGTDGNISVDPQFLDTTAPDPLDWDLHLDLASPLIDAGEPSILDPDGSPSDIGAYGGPNAEFWDLDWDGFPLWWQPGAYDHATYPDEGWDCDDMDATVFPGSGC